MGYMTNITILNDHFDWVRKNPKKFVEAIASGMNSGTESIARATYDHTSPRSPKYSNDREAEARCHYVTVHKAEHADTPQVIFTHCNAAYQIGDLTWGIYKGYLDQEAERHGSKHVAHLEQHYRGIAEKLHRAAKELENALDGKPPWDI